MESDGKDDNVKFVNLFARGDRRSVDRDTSSNEWRFDRESVVRLGNILLRFSKRCGVPKPILG